MSKVAGPNYSRGKDHNHYPLSPEEVDKVLTMRVYGGTWEAIARQFNRHRSFSRGFTDCKPAKNKRSNGAPSYYEAVQAFLERHHLDHRSLLEGKRIYKDGSQQGNFKTKLTVAQRTILHDLIHRGADEMFARIRTADTRSKAVSALILAGYADQDQGRMAPTDVGLLYDRMAVSLGLVSD